MQADLALHLPERIDRRAHIRPIVSWCQRTDREVHPQRERVQSLLGDPELGVLEDLVAD